MFVHFSFAPFRLSQRYIMSSSLSAPNRVTRQSTRIAASIRADSYCTLVQTRGTKQTRPDQILDQNTKLDQSTASEHADPVATVNRSRKKGTTSDQEYSENLPHKKKPRKIKPEPIYIIPDVERKETTFKGRLGYACLNTVLRNKKPASESIFCSRTCRLDNIKKNGIDVAKELGKRNVEDLFTMIQWNEDNHIRFLRLSSEMFPYASHGIYGYSLDYCAPLLARAGALANKYGHRLTTHPGQYTQLGSPRPGVIEACVRELAYHSEMLDTMGVGVDGVMIVHGGGMYENKTATLERIKKTITEVLPPNVRQRLVLENDELCYTAEDLLPLCEELDVPLVFDYHHDILNPSSIPPKTVIERATAIWRRRGIRPKQHLSEPRPGAITLMEKRAHADRCEALPIDLPDDMDLMIEAKDKEQAVLHLYRMYGLHPITHASLRPPDANPTKETKGRKSTKRARAKAEKLREELEGSTDSIPGSQETDTIISETRRPRKKRRIVARSTTPTDTSGSGGYRDY
ncbi:UV-endonuclease UvdE-domain-containing protein [Collybia nuda]|uniref:UV-endonuclease UvdE-domain-containing protein n=1 Tax=Collybia nuda TaxID=64659 RepID=A0A9P5Y342_9AGAR|nr:UV-endonuclease UvdE-domain-containing protein [Collybia nuda]